MWERITGDNDDIAPKTWTTLTMTSKPGRRGETEYVEIKTEKRDNDDHVLLQHLQKRKIIQILGYGV